MYKHYENLTEEEVKQLTELKGKVTFTKAEGIKRVLGANGSKSLSIYSTSRWLDWKPSQRALFKEHFPESVRPKILNGWFLEIPAGKGFLDAIKTWNDVSTAGTIICTALKDQTILLNGESVRLSKGEQIGFSLSTTHEIKPSKAGQLWACVMTLDCPTKVSD